MLNDQIIGQIGLHTFVIREGLLNAEVKYLKNKFRYFTS